MELTHGTEPEMTRALGWDTDRFIDVYGRDKLGGTALFAEMWEEEGTFWAQWQLLLQFAFLNAPFDTYDWEMNWAFVLMDEVEEQAVLVGER